MAQQTTNQAKVVNFRRGRHTSYKHQFLVEIEGVSDRETAQSYSGKEAVWKTSSGKEIKGKIADAHGNRGLVKVKFEKGLPGQALGTEIELR